MKPALDETHEVQVQSWVESANIADADFPIQNLPVGVFRQRDRSAPPKIGVAIGDRIVSISGILSEGLLTDESLRLAANACS
jgi:fumarylacetoacetase